jgi:hypothetical protein
MPYIDIRPNYLLLFNSATVDAATQVEKTHLSATIYRVLTTLIAVRKKGSSRQLIDEEGKETHKFQITNVFC